MCCGQTVADLLVRAEALGKINYEQKETRRREGEQEDAGGEGINKEKEIERESPSGFGSDFWS
jgi:hypothetical protein